MNMPDLRILIHDIAKLCPAFLGWAEDQSILSSGQSSGGSGTLDQGLIDSEWDSQMQSWQRTLSAITLDGAQEVLRRMENCSLEIPPYGSFARTINREAKREAEAKKATDNRNYADPQKFQCLACRDSGITHVWNPQFTEAYRGQFENIKRTEVDRSESKLGAFLDRFDPSRTMLAYRYDPPNWQHLAGRWWRDYISSDSTNYIPHLFHNSLCNCDCRKREVLFQELEKYNSNSRRSSKGDASGPPACGMAWYNPRVMPLKTTSSWSDLSAWYESHKPSEVYAWQP